MRLPAAALLLALYACSGDPAPATILVNLAPDAAADAPDDAQPPVDAAAPDGSQDAAQAQDAATSPDACAVDPPDAGTFTNSSCTAASLDGVCPTCAPYGFTCLADGVPDGVPIDGLRRVRVDGGTRWCATESYCVRDAVRDSECSSAASPHTYSCSTDQNGKVVAPVGEGCAVHGGGGGLTCCP